MPASSRCCRPCAPWTHWKSRCCNGDIPRFLANGDRPSHLYVGQGMNLLACKWSAARRKPLRAAASALRSPILQTFQARRLRRVRSQIDSTLGRRTANSSLSPFARKRGMSPLLTPFVGFIGEQVRDQLAQPAILGVALEIPVPVQLKVDFRRADRRLGDADV